MRSYKSGVTSWFTYCNIVKVDPDCRYANQEDWSVEDTEHHILEYTAIQCGIRGLCPSTLSDGYLLGIENAHIRQNRKPFFVVARKSLRVKNTLTGFKRLYDQLHPMSSRLKLPFGMDLARASRGVMDSNASFATAGRTEAEVQMRRDRMYLVMAVGINFMFRKGEHIRKSDGKDSGLTRNNITFLDYSGRRIPYHLVGDPSYKAKKMTINTRFSKTDHSGFGRRPWHERQESPAKEEVCVVTLVERWVAMTRDLGAKEGDELYHVPGFEVVCVDKLHEIMKATTIIAAGGEDIDQLSTTHSLRYGGATMMSEAGFPQYLIAHYGGWTADSTALRKYIRPSADSIARVSEFMTTMALGTPSKHGIEDALASMRSAKK
jgi:hypothetical protein